MFEELYAKIPNQLPFEEELSNRAVALYYYIAENVTLGNYAIVSLRNLLNHFGYKNQDRYYPLYSEALYELEEMGYVEIFDKDFKLHSSEEISKDQLIYVMVKYRENEYFQAYLTDVHSIMKYAIENGLKSRDAIIRYYLMIQRWTNYTGWLKEPKEAKHGDRIAYYTARQANNHIGIDASTFKKYNEILSQLGIYYIDNSYLTSNLKNTPTVFARTRVWDKQEFIDAITSNAWHNKYIKYDKDATNIKRSITQKKNYAKKRKIA